MLFKDISYLLSRALGPFVLPSRTICANGRGHYEENSGEIILNLDKWFRRRCRLKYISYLELGWLVCSAEQNHLCKFSRGNYEVH